MLVVVGGHDVAFVVGVGVGVGVSAETFDAIEQ